MKFYGPGSSMPQSNIISSPAESLEWTVVVGVIKRERSTMTVRVTVDPVEATRKLEPRRH